MKTASTLKLAILFPFIIALTAFLIVLIAPSGARNPNIIFILADDVGWGDLGAYGHPYAKTPNIDSLAAEGTMFHRFYVTGFVCQPSRAGFMTSRSPATFIKPDTGKYGLQGRLTITELLNNHGYATGHFGKWAIGDKQRRDPGAYGIDEYSKGIKVRDNIPRDAEIFAAALRFIENQKDTPFYINIWTKTAHYAVDPYPSVAAVFKEIEVKREDFSKFMQEKFDVTENAGRSLNEGMAAYLGEIYALDVLIGNLLRKLDELGLRNDTIVVFSSDNGPAHISKRRIREGSLDTFNNMGDTGGFRGGKHTAFEGGVRMPFIIRWPGNVPAGSVNTTSITSGLDWLPTLASITGAPYEKQMFEGEDVSDIWRGSKRSRANILFWGYRVQNKQWQSAMLQGDWKVHVRNGEFSLYNLADNSEEDVDLTATYPEIVEKFKRKWDEWTSTLPNEDGSNAVVVSPADIPKGT